MYENILFSIWDNKLDLYGETFELGEASTEVLNITPDEYSPLKSMLSQAVELKKQYAETKELSYWSQANELYSEINDALCTRRVFQNIRSDKSIFDETRELLSDGDDSPIDIYEARSAWVELAGPISLFDFDPVEHEELLVRTNRSRAVLIDYGDWDEKWKVYDRYTRTYQNVLDDIASFNYTIHNFIKFYVSGITKFTPDSIGAALYDFFNNPRRDKLIANPLRGTGLYTNRESVHLYFLSREITPDSGDYRLCECYETTMLQTLLKVDYYKALERGHMIRRCEYCGRYFLLAKAYHTKYCNMPAPDNPKYTCAQLGYRASGVKEAAGNNPYSQALRRCMDRVKKDQQRSNITVEERDRIIAKAQDILHKAVTFGGVTASDFDKSLQKENLYPLCGVVRSSRPIGRPRNTDDE